ncbi:MAG: RyR domain-containing protein [Opitutaceae bacterium]|jgi:hypothetical protein
MSHSTPASVLVCGDLILDQHIYEGERTYADTRSAHGVRVTEELGGAGLLHRFLASAVGADKVHAGFPTVPAGEFPPALRAYATWKSVPISPRAKERVWRVASALGYGAGEFSPRIGFPARESFPPAEVVVIDDSSLGFRFWPSLKHWPVPESPAADSPRWVVLKLSGPVAEGDLWRRLSDFEKPSPGGEGKGWLGRLVVIVSASNLRREGANIGQGVSWERTVEDLVRALENHPPLRDLARARHLIVTFGCDGAFWRDNQPQGAVHRCLFDRGGIEGDFERIIPGRVFGSQAIFTAAIASHLGNPEGIDQGIDRGLQAMRELLVRGHGPAEATPAWPMQALAKVIQDRVSDFAVAEAPRTSAEIATAGRDWMLCGLGRDGRKATEPLVGLATRIARFGVESVTQIPCAKFGKLTTADRQEIEALRQIRNLIQNYHAKARPERPLSLAAFGPPGAGKSFGIKQIARGVLGDDVAFLEFNLSQIAGENEIVAALHQVRDKALEGRTPFVFWDEFDSGEYRWLRSFLAPMQDGKFLDGQLAHAVGKCVFVFAGGTSPDWDHFGPPAGDEKAEKQFVLAKGPDFRSRVAGVLNVLGPNPRQHCQPENKLWTDDPADLCWPVRRAILLRTWAGVGKGTSLDIDAGLLAALLEVPRYTNGARSLERLFRHLLDQGGAALRPAHLPPREQLAMSADADAFLAIIERFAAFRAAADVIAPAIHEGWRREMARQTGQPLPAQQDYLQEFAKLPAHMRADNIAAARRIIDVLALVGLSVVRAGDVPTADDQPIADIIDKHLEFLAEAEHDGWMAARERNGWIKGPRDQNRDAARQHPLFCHYRDLEKKEQDKDRGSVRLYPEFVRLAGFRIVPRTVRA